MGNDAYLRGLNTVTSEVEESSIVRTSVNSLPVLWFAAFEPGNRHIFSLPLNSGLSIGVPALISASSQAAERLERRAPFLRHCLPTSLHPIIESWHAWLARIRTAYIGLDPAELALMLQTEDIESWLTDSCSAFDDQSPDKLANAFDVTGLEFDSQELRVIRYDTSLASVALTGF